MNTASTDASHASHACTPHGAPKTGAQLFVRCLEAEGVREMWGYPGGAIMPVYDALLETPIRHYLTRHEQAAAFAAQGFARTTGRPGVCLATSGPGATNLVTGLADALMDSVPLVAVTGQVPSHLIGTDAFQEADVLGLTMPAVKHSWQPRSADELPRVVREAFRVAAEGRPGPVLIDLPKDVQQQTTTAEPLAPDDAQAYSPRTHVDRFTNEQLDAARALMRSSSRPVIYAGGGVRMAGAWEELRAFAEATGAPIVHTLHGLGGVPFDHPLFLGMLGMHGLKAANLAVQGCDLLIAVGARFDDRVTGKLDTFAPHAAVIHVDVDGAELGKLRRPAVSLRGDLRRVLPTLATTINCADWQRHVRSLKAEHAWPYDAPFESIYAPRLLRDLSLACDENTYVCCDVGQHQMLVAQHFGFRNPRQHLTSGGLGTMGFGLPAAIGAKIARPDANVFCVTGDGSIMMNVQELATLRRYGVGVKILLLDNAALGMVRQWQELFFSGRESEIDLSDNPDFAHVARAFGIDAVSAQRADEVSGLIDTLISHPGPLLAHVKIDRHANVWPLVPPGGSNGQMLDDPKPPRPQAVAVPA